MCRPLPGRAVLFVVFAAASAARWRFVLVCDEVPQPRDERLNVLLISVDDRVAALRSSSREQPEGYWGCCSQACYQCQGWAALCAHFRPFPC